MPAIVEFFHKLMLIFTISKPPYREQSQKKKTFTEWQLAKKLIPTQHWLFVVHHSHITDCSAQQSFWILQLEKSRLWVHSLIFNPAWCTAAPCFAITDPKQSRCHALRHTGYRPGWPKVPKGLNIFPFALSSDSVSTMSLFIFPLF